ncbi:conserved hypothetical protein [Thioalkalivibrio sulfidiphilus HL-EbGr7]|uniref:Uncharacterized protein n=1 Tax=Thioalkalivibrio sulfidiphilus (strain HL-EbGR7) TaxID=396588 RepID=B8GM51_THISH|nr:hypothetical protein [Thioalkalivibrio sulfidiphilus]ACL73638.1 conserved hypothetical protein [Thioalkalivibrio sulfidiphilus HL-EbGr7]
MSGDSIGDSFRRAGIHWARRLVDEYAFALDGIPELIRVRFYQGVGQDWFETEQSHYLQTPGMATPEVSDIQRYGSLQEALDDVLKGFSEGYRVAVRAGHRPDTSWLLPNRDFH